VAASYRLVEREREIEQPVERGALETRRDALYRRLEGGYQKVERGLAEGRDVAEWEDFWIALLREYERVCDDLERDLAA
jgi:hypothetical protein